MYTTLCDRFVFFENRLRILLLLSPLLRKVRRSHNAYNTCYVRRRRRRRYLQEVSANLNLEASNL